MKNLTAVAGAGIATLAVGLALVGCGSDSSTEATSSPTTTSAEEETPTPAEAAGPNQTIQDYVTENNIQETAIKRGDPGPTVDLPVPAGWAQTDELPSAPYGAIIFPGSAVPNNPPRILALLSKLTGNVDAAQILEYAPGELQNMPGWSAGNEGQPGTLSGFDAVQLGGTYQVDGQKGMIAQKTVVIPGQDGVYVLQLNAYSDESEAKILADATTIIDQQTTITP